MKKKILTLAAVVTLPFILLVMYLLASMASYSNTYDEIVSNMTVANNYNLNFKEEMDESLYKLVVGYVTLDTIETDKSLKNPYTLIDELRSEFTRLTAITTESESKLWLESLLRNIDTLEKRVDDIVDSISAGGRYNENIEKLDNNIYILTELIQDDIQYYIYYQTESMEKVTDTLNTQIRTFIIICACLIAVLTIGLVMAVMQITTGMLRPIQVLAQAAGRISKGDLDARADVDSRDEIAVLADRFNDMAGNIQTLVVKVREDEQKMRKADLRLLQEQINPHFLYNTLDTIMWLAIDHQDDKVVEMVAALSGFFRTSLSHGEDKITIREELEHVENYLKIQQLRYGDIMEYSIDVPDEIKKNDIVKITLQPLVENALYHGLKKQREKGMIKISRVDDENNIFLIVEDNGVGMQPEQVVQINKEMYEDIWVNRTTGFGIANVNRRIKLYYGEEYGLILESEPDIGTKVIVVVPKTRQAEKK